MDLNVSALAAACLVEEIREHANVSEVVDSRLEDVSRDGEWIDELAAFYRRTWEEHHPANRGAASLGQPLAPDQFCELLSWCLAPCSRDGSLPSPASIQPGPRVQESVAEMGGSWSDPSLRLGVYGWVVGRGVAAVHARYPAALPLGELTDQVPVPVYEGLVRYVESAGPEPWPEMTTSAVLWRLGALGQAIAHKPTRESVEWLITLSAEARAKPVGILGSWARQFTGARNGLTHVHADVPDDLDFLRAVELHPDVESIFDHLELATAAMSRLANTALLDVPEDWAAAQADYLDRARDWM